MKYSARAIGLTVAAIVAQAVNVIAAAPQPFVLASGGRAQAVVVPYNGDTNGIGYAANELARYLGKISGAPFMVADKPVKGYKTLLVGAPYKPSKTEELCIRVKDRNTLEFTGDGARGTLYAVYDFLETLGVVFSMNDYEYIPSIRDLSIAGDFAKTDAPCMTWRDGWGVITLSDMPYTMKLRMHTNPGHPMWKDFGGGNPADIRQTLTGHWMSPRKYFKDHPEWYAFVRKDNKRGPHWVCVSHDGMYGQLYKEIDEELQKHPDMRELSLGLTDTPYLCECEKCLKLIADNLDPDGTEAWDIQLIEVANRVGRHFAKKYPNVRFNFLNYGGRVPVAGKVKLEPNVGGAAAELWRNHALSADNNERSSFALQRVAAMSNPGMGPYIWEYYCNFASYLIPFPNLYTYGQTARYYKRIGVVGAGAQMQMSITGDMAPLHFWLYAKLLWNPDADEHELVRHYIEATYGAAAKQIQEYVDLLEHARLRQRYTWYGAYVDDTSHYLTADDCLRIHRLFESAMDATRGDPERRRIVKRAKLAAVTMDMFRYYDMLAPAARQRVKLPTREQLIEEWNAIMGDSMHFARSGDICEGGSADPKGFRRTFVNPAEPTVVTNHFASVSIPPAKMTGGKKMTIQKDPAGFDYAQLKVKLNGEPEGVWMNPDYAEIGYTVHTNANAALDETGEWYVFANVRLGATVSDDKAAAYIGHYQPWYVNGVKLKRSMETANMPVPARKDDGSWRTLCLGKRRLCEGSRIWVMPGVLHPTEFQDVKSFAFVAPEIIENPKATAKSEHPSIIIESRGFDPSTNVVAVGDAFDNFTAARLTNATDSAITYTVKKADAGAWHILLNIRSGASITLDSNAAVASITKPGTNGVTETVMSVPVSGSLGDEAWQVVSLGVHQLEPGMQIQLAAGTNTPPRYTDLRRITLLDPIFLEQTVSPLAEKMIAPAPKR